MQEDQLLFLISQPRSGSSLMQQLLLNSNQIYSEPEPWIMLSLISTYKNTPISEGYNPNFTAKNFNFFLNAKADGLKHFKKNIKELALNIYNERKVGTYYFLDKTPRYYHVLEELYELFPKAKFVFLVRNPLSVFTSILDYNFRGKYYKFLSSPDRLDDLFLAPEEISRFIKNHDNQMLIKYEELVKNPDNELKKIFSYLSLDVPLNKSVYIVKGKFNETNSIDTKSLKKNNQPTEKYLDNWRKSIDNSQKKKLAIGFLKELQTRHSNYFDYDLDEILKDLKKHKPHKNYLFNLSFDLARKNDKDLKLFKLIKKRLILKSQR